jgi:DNA-binding NarL/FixJ family response regulator
MAKTKQQIRVLLADDHAIFRDGLRKLLGADEDITIVGEAQNGAECIKMLAKLKPDILLLDLRMPDKDGLAVLEEVNFDTLPTRVVVLTAAEDDRDVVRAMRLGARGVVLKQSATDLLVKSIHRVFAGEIWLDNRMTAARETASQRSRERDRSTRRSGIPQQGNRRKAVHQRADRQKSPAQHLRQARRFRSTGTRPVRDPPSADRPELVSELSGASSSGTIYTRSPV